MSDTSRILSYMNKDHRLAIEDYLCVYGGVTIDSKVANIKLRDIELDHMTIGFNHEYIEEEIIKPIPFDPPMTSMSEARTRLVTMAKEAAHKRGYSHITINEVAYPEPRNYPALAVIAFLIWGFHNPDYVYQQISGMVLPPAAVSFLCWITPPAFYLLVFAHSLECILCMRPRLNKYRVPLDFKIEWMLMCLVEGFPSWKRFDKLVKKYEKSE